MRVGSGGHTVGGREGETQADPPLRHKDLRGISVLASLRIVAAVCVFGPASWTRGPILAHSQCILLALCVCALGRGLPEKVLGLGQRRGGVGSPPPPPYSPPNCRTPLGVTHWLAAAPVGGGRC